MKEFWPFTIPEDKPGLFPFSLNYRISFEKDDALVSDSEVRDPKPLRRNIKSKGKKE